MRRWSWRPQARPLPDGTTFPRSSHQRMGFQGEGTSFPLVFFPLFLQRNRAPPGRAPFPPVPTAWRKEPSPRQTDRNTPLPPQENQFNKENNLWNASNPGPCPVLWSSCPPGKPSLSGCWRPSAPPMPSTASPRWTPPSLNRRRSSWPKAGEGSQNWWEGMGKGLLQRIRIRGTCCPVRRRAMFS